MKWYFSLVLLCFLIGCKQTDERSDFIRLEKELATVSSNDERCRFTNPYLSDQILSYSRMAEYTDTLLDIASMYDSLIMQQENPAYVADGKKIFNKIYRRRAYLDKRNKGLIDLLIKPNRNMDILFSKYAFRIKLSQILHSLYTITYCGNGVYSVMDLRPFITYQKQGESIDGEYGLGYVVDDGYMAVLSLSHLNKKISPTAYITNYKETRGTYPLNDTGIYRLTGYIEMQDPLTGQIMTIKQEKDIYAKPNL